jgi:hypothetical protein
LRASLLKFSELFLHLLEQNHRRVPSFLTYIMPVPAGKSLPQNEHFLGLGIENSSCLHFLSGDFLCFSFGFAEHQNVLNTHWTLDVSRYNATLVFAL